MYFTDAYFDVRILTYTHRAATSFDRKRTFTRAEWKTAFRNTIFLIFYTSTSDAIAFTYRRVSHQRRVAFFTASPASKTTSNRFSKL